MNEEKKDLMLENKFTKVRWIIYQFSGYYVYMQSEVWGQASCVLEFSQQDNPITQWQVGLETINPRDTYSSSSSFLFIIPIHLIEIFYSIEVCGWVFSWKWMNNINSKFILYSFKTVKTGKRMIIFLNCLLSIDIWALFASATLIQDRRAKENNPLPYEMMMASQVMTKFLDGKYFQSQYQVERHWGRAEGEQPLPAEPEPRG